MKNVFKTSSDFFPYFNHSDSHCAKIVFRYKMILTVRTALIQPYRYRPRHQIWLFLLQTSNLVPKRGSRWFLTSSSTHCHMSVFTAFLAHFPIFWLFSLIKSTFLDPKLVDIHKLLALHYFRSRSGLFLIQGSQKTKKNEVPGNTTDLSTSHGRISF